MPCEYRVFSDVSELGDTLSSIVKVNFLLKKTGVKGVDPGW